LGGGDGQGPANCHTTKTGGAPAPSPAPRPPGASSLNFPGVCADDGFEQASDTRVYGIFGVGRRVGVGSGPVAVIRATVPMPVCGCGCELVDVHSEPLPCDGKRCCGDADELEMQPLKHTHQPSRRRAHPNRWQRGCHRVRSRDLEGVMELFRSVDNTGCHTKGEKQIMQ